MQEQRFTLSSGNIAVVSPGVLRVELADTGDVRAFDLAQLADVSRDGTTVTAMLGGERIDLPMTSLTDADQLEAALQAQTRSNPAAPAAGPTPRQYMLRNVAIGLLIVAGVIAFAFYQSAQDDEDDGNQGDVDRPGATVTTADTSDDEAATHRAIREGLAGFVTASWYRDISVISVNSTTVTVETTLFPDGDADEPARAICRTIAGIAFSEDLDVDRIVVEGQQDSIVARRSGTGECQ